MRNNSLVDIDVTDSTDRRGAARTETQSIISARGLDVWYGDDRALHDVDMDIPEHRVTAIIGPSGCGKSTFLRCLNRMNDMVESARIEGAVRFDGTDIYDDAVDPIALRRQIGMVFQYPNPFPKSIYRRDRPSASGLAPESEAVERVTKPRVVQSVQLEAPKTGYRP